MQNSTFTQVLLGHGSVEVPLLARPQPTGMIIMCAVGGGEAPLLLPGGISTTDALVQSRLFIQIVILSPSVKSRQLALGVGAAGVRGRWLVV